MEGKKKEKKNGCVNKTLKGMVYRYASSLKKKTKKKKKIRMNAH